MSRSREAEHGTAGLRRRRGATAGTRRDGSPRGHPPARHAPPASRRVASNAGPATPDGPGREGNGRGQGLRAAGVSRADGSAAGREPGWRPSGTPCGQVGPPPSDIPSPRADYPSPRKMAASTSRQITPPGPPSGSRRGQYMRRSPETPRPHFKERGSPRARRVFLVPPPSVPETASRGRGKAQLRDTPWLRRPADSPRWRETLREAALERSDPPTPPPPAAAERVLRRTLRRYRIPFSSHPPLPTLLPPGLAAPTMTLSAHTPPPSRPATAARGPHAHGPRRNSPWDYVRSTLEQAVRIEETRTDAALRRLAFTQRPRRTQSSVTPTIP